MFEVAKHVLHPPLEGVGRDAPEQRRELHLVGDVDAGGAAADRVDVRQVVRRPAQGVHDALPVVLRVGLVVGIPLDLLAPDDATIDDRRHLAITAAQVEADTAAVQVAAQRRGRRMLGRQLVRRDDLDRMTVDALPDDLGVEAAGRAVPEVRAQLLDQRAGRVQEDAVAAPRPERELDQPLEHPEVRPRLRMGHGHQLGREA